MTEDAHDHDRGSDGPLGPTIRDRRRIDPLTGEVRPGAPSAPGGPGTPNAGDATGSPTDEAEMVGLKAELAERTSDLQRVQAEYLNYRRRVERDRDLARDQTMASVLTALFPVLDDIGRARDHGELVGGFRSVADALEQSLTKLGLETFGEVGDPFDPVRHEALMHSYSDEVSETTCIQVFSPGYRLGERVLRPARVAVADPTEALPNGGGAGADNSGGAGSGEAAPRDPGANDETQPAAQP